MTKFEQRKKYLELIKQKYKKGIPKLVIDELSDKCAKEFLKEKGYFMTEGHLYWANKQIKKN